MAHNQRIAHEVSRFMNERSTVRRHDSVISDKEREVDSKRLKVEIMALTLMELMPELGITREDMERKMKEIEERGWAINPPSHFCLCPKCGKKVFDYTEKAFEATCMYCGQNVPMYPGDTIE
ncbi:hypothetical protein SAMN06296952_2211 [Oscillospiraceae bacterium]|nr:hypothetical protein SAMN06296952_2211 [Oscillospiraceae bacterium]